MQQTLGIDFVSDIACAWCAVGLYSLERALQAFPGVVAEFRFHPYELDSAVGPEGANLIDHIMEKYEVPAEEVEESLKTLTERGAEVGFSFMFTPQSRIWNTFDAHRLLFWAAGGAGTQDTAQRRGTAETEGAAGASQTSGPTGAPGPAAALALEKALYAAYFTENSNVGDFGVLATAAGRAGLDRKEALRVLESGRYADELRRELALWRERGVTVVPTIRLNDRMTVTCAQTVSGFERTVRAALEGSPVPGMALM